MLLGLNICRVKHWKIGPTGLIFRACGDGRRRLVWQSGPPTVAELEACCGPNMLLITHRLLVTDELLLGGCWYTEGSMFSPVGDMMESCPPCCIPHPSQRASMDSIVTNTSSIASRSCYGHQLSISVLSLAKHLHQGFLFPPESGFNAIRHDCV